MSARDELIKVLAPARLLATVEGVEVLLVSVELWRTHVFVHLAGLGNDLMDRLLREHQALMERWGRDPNPSEPPEQPGAMLGRIDLRISDDVGTAYHPSSSSAGGTGTEWRADWTFEPGVPPEATRLTIAIGPDAMELAL
jgi:hypothetical protein